MFNVDKVAVSRSFSQTLVQMNINNEHNSILRRIRGVFNWLILYTVVTTYQAVNSYILLASSHYRRQRRTINAQNLVIIMNKTQKTNEMKIVLSHSNKHDFLNCSYNVRFKLPTAVVNILDNKRDGSGVCIGCLLPFATNRVNQWCSMRTIYHPDVRIYLIIDISVSNVILIDTWQSLIIGLVVQTWFRLKSVLMWDCCLQHYKNQGLWSESWSVLNFDQFYTKSTKSCIKIFIHRIEITLQFVYAFTSTVLQ